MKTIFKSAISIIFFIILFAASSKAQQPSYTQVVSKSSLIISSDFPSKYSDGEIVGVEKVNPKLLDRFNKTFSRPTNVKWQRLGDNYLATFSINETTTRSLLNKKGQLIYRIDYCSEKQLPPYIKYQVNNDYDDYLITFVAKVWQDNREIWVMLLSGQFHYKIVRVEDGEMEEVEDFKKAN